jgi:mannosyl-oligosaccharide glucosidase
VYTPESPPDPFALFQLQNEAYADANVYAFQKAFAGSGITRGSKWGFDVFYEPIEGSDKGMTREFRRWPVLTPDLELSNALASAKKVYETRFDATFPLPAPFNTEDHKTFAQAITSNLLGGIGYYHGASIVDRNFKHDYDETDEDEDAGEEKPALTEERELLTATPSRSFFPRGFYWDEGFHLALVGEWDNDLRWAMICRSQAHDGAVESR